MSTFIIFKPAFLFKAPDLLSERLGVVKEGTKFEGTKQVDGFIKTRIPELSAQDGFVLMSGFAQDLLTAPEPIHPDDTDAFCALVTRAARDASTDRDYLLAVAYSLSNNLTDMGKSDSPRVGPFRYSESEWNAAITTGVAKDLNILPEDRFRWYCQPRVAAFLAADGARQFEKAFNRLPTFKELFFMQLVGSDALAVLKDHAKLCKDVIPGTPEAGSYAAELKAGALSVEEALAELQKRLTSAYAEALKVIDKQPPEIRFFRARSGDPPWLAVAREEMASGVSETPDRRNTAQIQAYFADINMPNAPSDTPWCAAFVAHCMKHCGVATIAATVNTANAAGTLFWETWGQNAAVPPPVGSVVVLRPGGSGGHVGFLAEGSTPTVTKLLGGNQGGGGKGPDRVGIVDFPVATNPIVATRWIDAPADVVAAKQLAGDDLFVQKAPVVMKQLMKEFPQFTVNHVAGILGNIGQECGGFRELRQKGMPEDMGGYGWCQWDDRSKAFRKFASDNGLKWQDDAANLGYLIHELKTTEHPAFLALLKETDLENAVISFNNKFERSGTPMMGSRIRYAQLALQSFRKLN